MELDADSLGMLGTLNDYLDGWRAVSPDSADQEGLSVRLEIAITAIAFAGSTIRPARPSLGE